MLLMIKDESEGMEIKEQISVRDDDSQVIIFYSYPCMHGIPNSSCTFQDEW
jgi:hypothetical protein